MTAAIYTPKGGSGGSTVAVALARLLDHPLLDLDGDAPSMVGLPQPETFGWPTGPGFEVFSIPDDAELPTPGALLGNVEKLGLDVVLDLGTIGPRSIERRALLHAVERETYTVCVLRADYLAIRSALRCGVRPNAVVLIEESGRALTRSDVEDVIGAPVVATVVLDPAVSRSIDAGLLSARLPSLLGESLSPLVHLIERDERERGSVALSSMIEHAEPPCRYCGGAGVVGNVPVSSVVAYSGPCHACSTVDAETLLCSTCLATTEWAEEVEPVETDAVLVEVCEGCGRPGTVVACRDRVDVE